MNRPEDDELELQSARERAEADDRAGQKARLAVEGSGAEHPLEQLAAERERKPFVTEMELAAVSAPLSDRAEHAQGFVPPAPKPELVEAKIIVTPQIDRSRFQTDLSQRKQQELGMSADRTAGGRTARLQIQPGILNQDLTHEPWFDESSGTSLDPHSPDSSTTHDTSSQSDGTRSVPLHSNGWPSKRGLLTGATLLVALAIGVIVYIVAMGGPSTKQGAETVASGDARAVASSVIASSMAPLPQHPDTAKTVAAPSETAPAVTSGLLPNTSASNRPRDISTAQNHPDPVSPPPVMTSHPDAPLTTTTPNVTPTAKPTASSFVNPNIF